MHERRSVKVISPLTNKQRGDACLAITTMRGVYMTEVQRHDLRRKADELHATAADFDKVGQ